MRKSSLITKCTLAVLDSILRVRRIDLALSLADFCPVTVVAEHFFKEFHDIARHVRHPLQTDVVSNYSLAPKPVLIRIKAARNSIKIRSQGAELGKQTAASSLGAAVGSAAGGLLFDIAPLTHASFLLVTVLAVLGVLLSLGLPKVLVARRDCST
jgi:hypothetical protein